MTVRLVSPAALPGQHAGGPDPTGFLWSDWSLEPTVVFGVFVLLALYFWWTGPRNRSRPGHGNRPVTTSQRIAMLGAAATMLVALGPPLDDWADHYLLSAHMVQHLLLTMLAAPLLLLGIPTWIGDPLIRRPGVNRIGYGLTRPIVAFLIANIVFVAWHLPILYEAALRSRSVHALEHQLFLATSVLVWWPIVGPFPAWPRLSLPLQCLYYFAQTIPGGMIGAFIVFAQPGLYVPYDTVRRIFGIGLATDQEMAGLIMWVGASTIYLILITIVFFRWTSGEEAKERGGPATRAQQPATRG